VSAPSCYADYLLLRNLDLIEQVGVTAEHFEQLDLAIGGLVLPFS
jgi:hypothetical protein